MKKLKVQLIDPDNKVIRTVTAQRFEATNVLTVISLSHSNLCKESKTIRLIEIIDHWNIMDGMITIYYESGAIIEITRIND